MGIKLVQNVKNTTARLLKNVVALMAASLTKDALFVRDAGKLLVTVVTEKGLYMLATNLDHFKRPPKNIVGQLLFTGIL